ncbi:MAG: TetR/AcrR family transcriptional regulator [Oscillospiraceae bacterium]|nr:TetR/AcrR family transcriptional regulator [Oscillospiraceae bacterium]
MGRNKYPEETVQKILDTAEQLFIEKGYDHASLQDIIDATGLSKGAIYHHFASKEDIFYSVCARIGQRNGEVLAEVRDNPALNGLNKLRVIFKTSLQPERQAKIFCMMPYLMDNAKFLATEMRSIFSEVVPRFVEPIIRQGITDGSIRTDHPKELAEAMMMLSDVWINPIVQPTTPEEIRARCAVYNQLFRGFGIDGLIDQEIIDTLVGYAQLAHHPPLDRENKD